MIYMTIERKKHVPPVVRRIKCFHCGTLLALRHSVTKKSCPECEHTVEKAKNRAGYAIRKEIAAGKILPATSFECWDCGEPATCFDHRNYSRPLDVQPVCVSCNGKRGPGILGDANE